MPSFREALRFWFKLGLISFGGPAGQIAIMHEELVTRKKWIGESQFSEALSFCTLLPGPEAQQMATYLGWKLHGLRGGVLAGLLFIIPSIILIALLSVLYVRYGAHPAAEGILRFLRPGVLAIIFAAFVRMARRSLITHPHFIAAFTAFLLMTFFSISFTWIIITALVAGWIIPAATPAGEPEPLALQHTPGSTRSPALLLAGFLLWLLPMVVVVMRNMDLGFWSTLAFFFTKTACITFGGAYAVLPYVADAAVNQYHWIEPHQVVDGLALGETTPGPLIMVLAFYGFMAGYNLSGYLVLTGLTALLFTVWYTFLPGFVFVLLGAPYVSRVSASPHVRRMMAMVSATVTGVILHLGWTLGKTVVRNVDGSMDWLAAGTALLIFIALRQNRIQVPAAVGLCVLAGIVYYLLGRYGVI